MTFGQSSGPPASAKQLSYLLSLVKAAGHADFRDARHPLDLTQRQAGGKFSTREASELIDRLVNIESGNEEEPPEEEGPLAGFPTRLLADELQRRGWAVTPPTT